MDPNTLPSCVRDFFAEVSLMDEEAFPPPLEKQADEELIGVVSDPWTRKLFATSLMHKRESERARVECKFTVHKDGENCEHAEMVNRHDYWGTVSVKLFWTIVNEHFKLWRESGTIGIRKGWEVVFNEDDDDGGGGIIGGSVDDMPDALREALIKRLKKK